MITTMFSVAKVTQIYCMADDFCKEFAEIQEKLMVEDRYVRQRQETYYVLNYIELTLNFYIFCRKHLYNNQMAKKKH